MNIYQQISQIICYFLLLHLVDLASNFKHQYQYFTRKNVVVDIWKNYTINYIINIQRFQSDRVRWGPASSLFFLESVPKSFFNIHSLNQLIWVDLNVYDEKSRMINFDPIILMKRKTHMRHATSWRCYM